MIDAKRATDVTPEPLVDEPLVATYFITALVYLTVSMLAGMLIAMQLVQWNPLQGFELFSPGRWRIVHTIAIAYGFLANAYLGAVHWAVPRLTLRAVMSCRVSWFNYVAWQVVILAAVAGIILGPTLQEHSTFLWELPFSLGAQGIDWGETPAWIDPLALAVLLLVAANFLAPITKVRGPLYLPVWYFMAALVWTLVTYAMGIFLPQCSLAGTRADEVNGLFIHDLAGLLVTPLGWGLMYYFVPIMLRKPMWSYGLSLVGLWGLASFCLLDGIYRFIYTPISLFPQRTAIIATLAVGMLAATVIVNLLGSIRGSGRELVTNLPLRWFFAGMVFYGIACLQCVLQATITLQALIQFTDWVVGNAHMVMFGVFGFCLLGIMTYLFPRLWHTEWYSRPLCEWHFWLSAVGLAVMISDLQLVGVLQGYASQSLEPWDVSVDRSIPFWTVRVFTGLMLLAGQLCLVYNLWMTWRASRGYLVTPESEQQSLPIAPFPQYTTIADPRDELSYLSRRRNPATQGSNSTSQSNSRVLLVIGLGFFLLAFLSNALLPALLYCDLPEATTRELVAKNSNVMYQFEELSYRYPEQFKTFFGAPTQEKCAEALELGRRTYINEGCWHCHSQIVRPVSRDEVRWGPVSRIEEYQNALQRPVMFGTRRVGPDLSREGGRHASDWHAAHFFRPELVSPGSTMPDYPWLFDGSPNRPNRRGLALITYVQWLGSWLESYPYYEDYEPTAFEPIIEDATDSDKHESS